MNVLDIKPISFLCFRATATLSELPSFIPVSQEIIAEAVKLKLPITGAVHWHYFDLTDMTKPFTLEVCVPVGGIMEQYDGKFHFKRTDNFPAVSAVHYGSWQSIPQTYDKIFKYISQIGKQPGNVAREVYINGDFNDLEANVTEIQVGIA